MKQSIQFHSNLNFIKDFSSFSNDFSLMIPEVKKSKDFADKTSPGGFSESGSFSDGMEEQLWGEVRRKITSQNISDPKLIELAMSSAIYKQNEKLLIKYLDVNKVNSLPVNTKYDFGRRFFYLLKILNKRCGYHLIKPYLDGLICHRPQEFRFLGGIYYNGLSLENAVKYFETALQRIEPFSYNTLYHKHLFHNYMICLSYLDEDDKLEKFIKRNDFTLKKFGSEGLVNRLRIMEKIKKGI